MKHQNPGITTIAAVASLVGCAQVDAVTDETSAATSTEALVQALGVDDVPSGTAIDARYTGVTFSEPLHGGHIYAVQSLAGNNNVISIHTPNDPTWGLLGGSNFAAEEGAVNATFGTLQKSVSVDARLIEAIEVVGKIDKKPYLEAYNSSGKLIASTYYPGTTALGWRTLTITRSTADIKRVRFSSQNNWAGMSCPSDPSCPSRMYSGHYGEFDNLRYDDGRSATSGYVGCYQDAPGRALPFQLAGSNATVTSCVNAVRAMGYAYAGLQAGGQCFAGNQLGLVKLDESACSTVCSADPAHICGGSWINSVYATGVAPVPGVSGKYLGCYVDDTTRALPDEIFDTQATVENCVAAAQIRGLRYAGLQWYGQCFAGSTLGFSTANAGDCNTKCDANQNEMCGGPLRNSVYDTGATAPPAVPSSAYKGCYTDDWGRALPTLLMPDGATVESCVAAAKNAGYSYAGVQAGGQCFGGNTLGYSKVADSDCSSPCISNPNEACGGSFRNSIWAAK
jgi:hypothetical protein